MLLFEDIHDAIIYTLAVEKSITIQDLHKNIVENIGISLPNFYKIISKLIADQILIKEGGKISIHKRWILGISLLSEKLNQGNNENNVQEIIQLKNGQFLEYFGGNILEIDGLWGNLMITLNIHYGKEVDTFVYQSHPYYMLGMKDTEMSFFEQEKELTIIHFLTGNTGLLDLYGIQFYKELDIRAYADNNVLFPKEGYCVTVIGDYIFEFIYPEHISEYFRLLFETTKLLELYNPELFRKIFETRARCKLTVRRNQKHAEEIRKKFIVL